MFARIFTILNLCLCFWCLRCRCRCWRCRWWFFLSLVLYYVCVCVCDCPFFLSLLSFSLSHSLSIQSFFHRYKRLQYWYSGRNKDASTCILKTPHKMWLSIRSTILIFPHLFQPLFVCLCDYHTVLIILNACILLTAFRIRYYRLYVLCVCARVCVWCEQKRLSSHHCSKSNMYM